jgi:hypothetical protein
MMGPLEGVQLRYSGFHLEYRCLLLEWDLKLNAWIAKGFDPTREPEWGPWRVVPMHCGLDSEPVPQAEVVLE